jgi:hypothetical protein
VRSGELQKVEIPGPGDGLRAALHAQFAAEVIDVPLDRVHAQDKATSDIAVGGTRKQQPQHLTLALGQRFHKRPQARRGGKKSRGLLLTESCQQGGDVPRYRTLHAGVA